MDTQKIHDFSGQMTEASWATLGTYLDHLPRKIRLVVWASEKNSCTEESAVDLAHLLASRFPATIEFKHRPRKPNYDFYPVMGVMGINERGKDIDYGIRFVGLPGWYQINTVVGAIQAVAFQGSTLSPKTRILLSRVPEDAEIKMQIFTTPEDEGGVLMGTLTANLAVISPAIKTWIVMINDFPQLTVRYSVQQLPHTVINQRHHLQGNYDEEQMLKYLARIIKREQTAA